MNLVAIRPRSVVARVADSWREQVISCIYSIVPEYSTYGKKWPTDPATGHPSQDGDNQYWIDKTIDFIRKAPKSTPPTTDEIRLFEYNIGKLYVDNVMVDPAHSWIPKEKAFAIYDCIAKAYGQPTIETLLLLDVAWRAVKTSGTNVGAFDGVGIPPPPPSAPPSRDLSYDPDTSIIPAAGESPSWWPLAALGSVAVIALIFFYGHKTGWT